MLGFSGLSVLLPQLLEGLAAIAVLYYLVRRRFSERAALLAALAAIGLTVLWSRRRERAGDRFALAGAFLVTAVWQLYVMRGVAASGAARMGFSWAGRRCRAAGSPGSAGSLAAGTLAALAGVMVSGRPIDPALWRSGPAAAGGAAPAFRAAAPLQLFDLRPRDGVVPAR